MIQQIIWSILRELCHDTILMQERKAYVPIRPIFMPERAKALRADWAPGPGVLVLLPPVARSLM